MRILRHDKEKLRQYHYSVENSFASPFCTIEAWPSHAFYELVTLDTHAFAILAVKYP